MRKIYLIEDRKQRSIRIDFKKKLEKIETEYSGFFEEKEFTIDSIEGLNEYIKTKFPDALAIIIHKSHNIFTKNNIRIENVKEAFFTNGVEYIINFSGGLNNNIIDDKSAVLSAKTLYSSNLEEFLKFYKNKGTINLPILIYGKEYLTNEILSFSYLLHNYLTNMENDIDIDEIIDIAEETLKSEELKDDKKEFIQWLNNSEITSDKILQTIQNHLLKYESYTN